MNAYQKLTVLTFSASNRDRAQQLN